ncbi:hypothetical protein URH17368_2831 [Alicyclobacillus hesperidum URH17-3-68]|nr:hypothetical protein URH17368_2831 [Alicyclobacillus hesperidum URH17-3-68]
MLRYLLHRQGGRYLSFALPFICQGESFTLIGGEYRQSGIFSHTDG